MSQILSHFKAHRCLHISLKGKEANQPQCLTQLLCYFLTLSPATLPLGDFALATLANLLSLQQAESLSNKRLCVIVCCSCNPFPLAAEPYYPPLFSPQHLSPHIYLFCFPTSPLLTEPEQRACSCHSLLYSNRIQCLPHM